MPNEEVMTPEQEAALMADVCRPDDRVPAAPRQSYTARVLVRSRIQSAEGYLALERMGFVHAVDPADAESQLRRLAAGEYDQPEGVLGVFAVARCEPAIELHDRLVGWSEILFRSEADARAYTRGEGVYSRIVRRSHQ
jgi:hypothetical protein